VVAQPDERQANKTASVLEWYDRHRASGSKEEVLIEFASAIQPVIIPHVF